MRGYKHKLAWILANILFEKWEGAFIRAGVLNRNYTVRIYVSEAEFSSNFLRINLSSCYVMLIIRVMGHSVA